jgi:Flp pilus assembly protein TadG
MKPPAIRRSPQLLSQKHSERGVTMVLMALAMVAILAMAALSIDVVTLYLANAEAQRSADTAALAAARVLSISGMTGDPSNSAAGAINPWQQACALATSVAKAVATQNTMGGIALLPAQVTVTFPNSDTQCAASGPNLPFGVNPLVTVKVQRTDLPTFFARMWGRTGASVSATATAEAFNASNSGNVGNGAPSGQVTPVAPRCVKPWIVPNRDPGNPGGCIGAVCNGFVSPADGSILNPGIQVNGGTAVIGEGFWLTADCPATGNCSPLTDNPPSVSPPSSLEYLPAAISSTSTAVPGCSVGGAYEQAIAGCDQTTVYACGTQLGAGIDLTENPGGNKGDTLNGVQCLINWPQQDSLDQTNFPYRILAGPGNPLVNVSTPAISSGAAITTSNSIVTIPIYDGSPITSNDVTIVGFLQAFIDRVNPGSGDVHVFVLNVSGCSSSTSSPAVPGTSPVPVRLITYP